MPPKIVDSDKFTASQLHEIDASHLKDAWVAMDAFFRDDPYFLTRHHLDSYDRFISHGLADTLRKSKPISLLKDDVGRDGKSRKVEIDVRLGGKGVRVDIPTLMDASTRSVRPLLPNEARLRDLTYGTNVYVDVEVQIRVDGKEVSDPKAEPLRPICLGQLPLMLHSRYCPLRGLSADALKEAGECPYDRGGYFVVDGKEKIIVAQEANVLNRVYVRKGDASRPEIAYLGFMLCESPDDPIPKSMTLYVRSQEAPSRKGAISVVVNKLGRTKTAAAEQSARAGKATGSGEVPLFVLFRALGVESDKAILEHIVYSTDSEAESDVLEFLRPSILEAASKGVTDQRTALEFLERLVPADLTLKAVLTEQVFPNVGFTRGGSAVAPTEDLDSPKVKVGGAEPPRGDPLSLRALFLGQAIRRLVRTALGKEEPLDRDDFANRRLDVSGALLAKLFRDIYIRQRARIAMRLDAEWQSGAWRISGDVTRLVGNHNIASLFEAGSVVTDKIHRSMKGSWGADDKDAEGESNDAAESGIVQDLSRLSYMSYVSHVRRSNKDMGKDVKLADPHKLRASHWGAVCPVESPDGPNIGMLNHLATLTSVTLGSDPAPVLEFLGSMKKESVRLVADAVRERRGVRNILESLRGGACRVVLNDTWVAITTDPLKLVETLKKARRDLKIDHETSIAWNIAQCEIGLSTARGRFVRPLCALNHESKGANGSPLPTLPTPLSAAVRAVGKKDAMKWDDLFQPLEGDDAPLEHLDIEELKTKLVAMRPSDVARAISGIPTASSILEGGRPLGERYTHLELHVGGGILSPATNTFPMLNHNAAARNVFGLAQFKQALGTYSSAYHSRMDALSYVLHQPQRPIVGTRFADKLCNGQLAMGENVIVAVCVYSGYNMEDAIIVNKDAVERGRLQGSHYETHVYDEFDGESSTFSFANPTDLIAKGVEVAASGSAPKRYGALESDGIPRRNEVVREGDVVLGMVETLRQRPSSERKNGKNNEDGPQIVDRSVLATKKTSGVIDACTMFPVPSGSRNSSGSGVSLRRCKVRTRSFRQVELGDKLASRFSQKGCVGMLLPAIDMPFSASTGITPDILINPHGFPTRNTGAHVIECILGKAGVVSGSRYNVNTLEEPQGNPIEVAMQTLEDLGFNKQGEEILHNGRTGEQMNVAVYMGVNYYGRLKHHVQDKIQMRSRGPVSAIHRQPTKTQGGSGGLRIGEMEVNALISHGVSSFMKESLMDRSDRTRVTIDAEEGIMAYSLPEGIDGRERSGAIPGSGVDCGPPEFADVEVPYALKLMHQELATMGIDMKMFLDPINEEDAHDNASDTDDEESNEGIDNAKDSDDDYGDELEEDADGGGADD
jgi:DNA-directed RNA polymerase II subunit RPB2